MLTVSILQVCAVESAPARKRAFQLPHTTGFRVRRYVRLSWLEYETHLISIQFVAYGSPAYTRIKPKLQPKKIHNENKITFHHILSCSNVMTLLKHLRCFGNTDLFFSSSEPWYSGERSHLTTAPSPRQQKLCMQLTTQQWKWRGMWGFSLLLWLPNIFNTFKTIRLEVSVGVSIWCLCRQ